MRMPSHQSNPECEHSELKAIRQSVKEAIIVRDLDGVVASWNPAAEHLFVYKANEIIGKSFSLLIAEEGRAHESEILERTRQGEVTSDYELLALRKGGTTFTIAITFSPIRDGFGRIVSVLNIVQDVTQRKQWETAERDRLFLQSILSSADDAIFSKDLNSTVTSWNNGAERLFGYRPDEIIGKPITVLIPPDHVDEEMHILECLRRGERIEHYETRRRRKDGVILDVSLTISPIWDRLGRIIGVSKIARDITERRRLQRAEVAESFLGALVESAEDAIISKTLDGIVTNWNPAAERLYGYTAAEMIGQPIMILIPSDHSDEEGEILRRLRRGERIQHYETQRRRKDGRIIEVSQTISPIRDSLGRAIGISNITRDVTDQKAAERRERAALLEAQEAKRQAEEANRAKDEFLATVSHELRTPMTAIIGWSRMLITGQLSLERQQKAIEIIDRNARAQAQLIEDLLDVSRIVSGRLRIEFNPVDLGNVIAAAVEAARPAAEAKRIRVQTILSSGAGPVRGDADRLQQVIWNLLSNAIRFTPEDGFIRIELQRSESQVELRISDNGIGIKPDFLPHMFERFTQADPSITRHSGGLGMGLAIVKSLVELHGGVVTASSNGEGKGSTFTVKLPISPARQKSGEPPTAEKPVLPAALKEGHELVGLKILVVDDEEDTCELLRFVFNETGAIVETANTPEKGLELFDSWQPDVIVSDIGMPKVDGYQFIRIIRNQRHSRVPAIALTAMSRIEDRLKALTAGYQMHVSKPVEPVELISIVTSLAGLVNRRPVDEPR
jgi:PAS domain S-box-containing protein